MKLPSRRSALVLTFLTACGLPCASGFDIVFDYSFDTNRFFDSGTAAGRDARATLDAAAGWLESHIGDALAAIQPGAGQSWTREFYHPSAKDPGDPLGGALVQSVAGGTLPADTIVVYAGARALGVPPGQPILDQLSSEGSGGWVTWSYTSGNGAAWQDLLERRGGGRTTSPGAVDYAPWGGSISFDNDGSTPWNLDYRVQPAAGQVDLYAVAIHELCHVLGYQYYDVPSWQERVTPGGSFNGPAVTAVYGGPAPLNVAIRGLSDLSHWLSTVNPSPVYGSTAPAVPAMTPTQPVAARRLPTALDMAGLADIGWEIRPVSLDPAAGASWQAGSVQTVRWSSAGNLGSSVSIRLFSNGSPLLTVYASTANDGAENWTLPSTLPPGSGYQIEIASTSNPRLARLGPLFSVSPAAPDTQPPSVTVTSPTDGAVVSLSSLSVTGTASDNVGVAAVEMQLNGSGVWLTATGTTSWSLTLAGLVPRPLSNLIAVRARDASGNLSPVVSRTVFFEPPVADDHGDLPLTATRIDPTTTMVTGVLTAGDTDMFFIPNRGLVTLIFWSEGSTDTTGTITLLSGQQLAFDDNTGPGLNFRTSFFTAHREDLYLAVRHASGAGTGSYSVHIRLVPPTAALEWTFQDRDGDALTVGFVGVNGQNYQTVWSDDMVNWTPWLTHTGTGAEIILHPVLPADRRARFFSVRRP